MYYSGEAIKNMENIEVNHYPKNCIAIGAAANCEEDGEVDIRASKDSSSIRIKPDGRVFINDTLINPNNEESGKKTLEGLQAAIRGFIKK